MSKNCFIAATICAASNPRPSVCLINTNASVAASAIMARRTISAGTIPERSRIAAVPSRRPFRVLVNIERNWSIARNSRIVRDNGVVCDSKRCFRCFIPENAWSTAASAKQSLQHFWCKFLRSWLWPISCVGESGPWIHDSNTLSIAGSHFQHRLKILRKQCARSRNTVLQFGKKLFMSYSKTIAASSAPTI